MIAMCQEGGCPAIAYGAWGEVDPNVPEVYSQKWWTIIFNQELL